MRLISGKIPIRAYRSLSDAKKRCYNKEHKQYYRYGARGITISDEWLKSYEKFWEDMGPTYTPGLTLDRVNNDGPYSKENCKWSNRREQALNRSSNIKLTLNGKTQHVCMWSKELNLNRTTIEARYKRGESDRCCLRPVVIK